MGYPYTKYTCESKQNYRRHEKNLNISAASIRQQAYFSLVRPLLEYTSTVWEPYIQSNIKKLEMVQRRATRYVLHRHRNTSSVTDIYLLANFCQHYIHIQVHMHMRQGLGLG